MADVFVIVLNYRAAGMSSRCARSALASRGVSVELCVVDNASPDGSGAALAAEFGPDRVLQVPENTGYAGGMNAGLRRWREGSQAPHVLLLTQDVVLEADAVRQMLDVLERVPEAGIVGPVLQYGADHAESLSAGGFLVPERADSGHFRHVPSREPYPVEWADGGCLLVRGAAAGELGGFDERYFMYYEEMDFCERARRSGWQVLVLPDARALHETASAPGPHYFYYMSRNAFLFWRENYRVGVGRITLRSAATTARMAYGAAKSLLVPGLRDRRGERMRTLRNQGMGMLWGTLDYARGRLGRQRF